jgi:hypothetical protein
VRQDPFGVLREESKQLELFWPEVDFFRPAPYAPQIKIKRQISTLQLSGPVILFIESPSQDDAKARKQFVGVEGLGDVIIRTVIERSNLLGIGIGVGQDDDWDLGSEADLAADVDAFDVRQVEIQHNGIGRHPLERGERSVSRRCALDVVAAGREQRP